MSQAARLECRLNKSRYASLNRARLSRAPTKKCPVGAGLCDAKHRHPPDVTHENTYVVKGSQYMSQWAKTSNNTTMERLLYEVKKIIVGQDHLLERLIVALLARGHILVEGV